MGLKEISSKTYWQLLVLYTAFIIAIALGFLNQYTLYFNIFALLVAIFGISIISKEETNEKSEHSFKNSKKLHIFLFLLAIILIIFFRIIPYIHNSIPLGYDAGLYKYGIEHGLENKDKWILNGGMEPGFLYMMKSLSLFFSTDVLLKYVFIFFIVLLGFAIYMFSKEYFNDRVALFSILIYSLSVVQFKVFTYLYYKNIIALSLIFFSFYFLKREKYIFFILSGILLGSVHRPSFYIFGISYFLFALFSPWKNKKYKINDLKRNVLIGAIILIGALLFYLGAFRSAILSIISPVVSSFASPGESPGTFITFNVYQFATLFYLPFAILSFFYIIKNKKFNIFFFYTLILIIIIYFQFFFFNRFIIFLDTALIVLAGKGFDIILKEKKKLSIILIVLLLLSASVLEFKEAKQAQPIIPQSLFQSIQNIKETNIPPSSYIISISSEFSPFLQGWTNNRIIAPGLFDYDIWHSETRWSQFWQDLNASDLKTQYKEDIYLFTNKDLNSPCYQKTSQNLYKWVC